MICISVTMVTNYCVETPRQQELLMQSWNTLGRKWAFRENSSNYHLIIKAVDCLKAPEVALGSKVLPCMVFYHLASFVVWRVTFGFAYFLFISTRLHCTKWWDTLCSFMYIMYFIHIQPLPNLFFISTSQRSPSSFPVVFPLTFLSFMYLNVGLICERKRDIYFFGSGIFVYMIPLILFFFMMVGNHFCVCVPVLTHTCMYTSITFILSFYLSMVTLYGSMAWVSLTIKQ